MWGSFVLDNFNAIIVVPLYQTAIMVFISIAIATLVGLPLGVFLATSQDGEMFAMPKTNRVVGAIVNALRAIPFIILAVFIFPVTRVMVGTAIGTPAAIVPLALAATPFIARLIETLIREVDQGLVEAARAFGASPAQIVRKVLLPEAMPGIVLVLTLALISLIGYSAMVGAVGGGGLGQAALRYGYQENKSDVMVIIVILLIVLNQLLQMAGDHISRRINKRVVRTSRKPITPI